MSNFRTGGFGFTGTSNPPLPAGYIHDEQFFYDSLPVSLEEIQKVAEAGEFLRVKPGRKYFIRRVGYSATVLSIDKDDVTRVVQHFFSYREAKKLLKYLEGRGQ